MWWYNVSTEIDLDKCMYNIGFKYCTFSQLLSIWSFASVQQNIHSKYEQTWFHRIWYQGFLIEGLSFLWYDSSHHLVLLTLCAAALRDETIQGHKRIRWANEQTSHNSWVSFAKLEVENVLPCSQTRKTYKITFTLHEPVLRPSFWSASSAISLRFLSFFCLFFHPSLPSS